MANHASQLYARNVNALLGLMVKDGALSLDWDDEVARRRLRHAEGRRRDPCCSWRARARR